MNDPAKIPQYIWEKSKEYASAKATRIYLEQFRKSKKALLIVEAEQKGLKTGQERESYAYAHPEYLDLLKGLKEAVEQEELLRWRIVSCETEFKRWQTAESSRRAEMNLR